MRQTTVDLLCPMSVSEDETKIRCEFSEENGVFHLEWVSGLERELSLYEFHSLIGDFHETLERQAKEKVYGKLKNDGAQEAEDGFIEFPKIKFPQWGSC